MTLITWAITPEYAVIVSDRRVTRLVRGRAVSFEDSAMKTFLLNGQLLMGFTGLAEVGGQSMAEWVADRLAGQNPLDWPEILRDAMQAYYGTTPAVRGIPHHFRLLGFGYNTARVPARIPMGIEVSNCEWREAGGRVQAYGVGDFTVRHNGLGNHRVLVGAVGSPYPHRALRELERSIKFVHRANADNVAATFEPILQFHQLVSAKSGGTVGDTAVVTAIRSRHVPITDLGWSTPLTTEGIESATQHPFSATFSPNGDATAHLPVVIHRDIQLLDMTFGPDISHLGGGTSP
ncbi:hypothetical protein WDJ51_12115 [Rathayibacter sp. YIM 133350]|uniref:hypothetical protein n=1 Tax=Rathayibacter sp. YIM 133350 TaxID=3131992 RepID=UPI00307D41F2